MSIDVIRRLVHNTAILLVLYLGAPTLAPALPFQQLDFSLHKLGHGGKGQPTLLIVGGIQGDEPGGFNAASLLVTDYEIQHGSVWVVPNLNFKSIIRRSRGIYGDMNRKFLKLASRDPDYDAVQKIKSIIMDPRVTMILNLHDGSGFYRPEYQDKLRNPERWGQSIIIDQASLEGGGQYSALEDIAQHLSQQANGHINSQQHHFYVKNTYTRQGNQEMEKTLTYFAARHLKPAFGIEASKSFLTHERAFFHLQVIEATMDYLGIKYQRRFKLTKHHLKDRIDNNVQLSFFENKIFLDMQDARRSIKYVPLKKDSPLNVNSSSPLVAIINDRNQYRVQYGNRHITRLLPQYFEYDDSLDGINMIIDGKHQYVSFGSHVHVQDHFRVDEMENYRVNVIGYYGKSGRDEGGERIAYQDIRKRFSIDKSAKRFRVEVYTDHRYCGMVIVDFHGKPYASESIKTSDTIKTNDSST
jgi:hypothetical protein